MEHGSVQLPQMPHQWVNSEGLTLRLQCFVVIRNDKREVACVRLKDFPAGVFALPAETVKPNEDIDAAAARVGESWFGKALPGKVSRVLTWPGGPGMGHWFVLFVYEAQAPKEGLPILADTAEVRFFPIGKGPEHFAFDHASVFERLPP